MAKTLWMRNGKLLLLPGRSSASPALMYDEVCCCCPRLDEEKDYTLTATFVPDGTIDTISMGWTSETVGATTYNYLSGITADQCIIGGGTLEIQLWHRSDWVASGRSDPCPDNPDACFVLFLVDHGEDDAICDVGYLVHPEQIDEVSFETAGGDYDHIFICDPANPYGVNFLLTEDPS